MLPAYGLALVIGLLAAWGAFPPADLAGRLPPGAPGIADYLQHMTGQLYFVPQPWHWPLFEASRLDAPGGVNVALTDSIPLVAVLMKLVHPLWPGLRQGIGPWLGLAWTMQPVAAVFALRGTGERRLLPALAVAVIAASMPTFLYRYLHAALDGQFILLLATGLYLRATRPGGVRAGTRAAAGLAGLVAATLFIHPYLMAMTAAIAWAAPFSLAVRRQTARALRCAAIVGLGTGLAGLSAWVFGYLVPGDAGGYGVYSMNLAAPFWPALSAIIPGVPFAPIDGTGGQYEGYQYLGAGVLALLACIVVRPAGWRWLARGLARHAGLAAALLGVTAYAVSNHVYAFHHLLLASDAIPPGGQSLRASGRLFWPVTYVLVLVAVCGTMRVWPRVGALLLLVGAGLQVYDSWTLRLSVRQAEAVFQMPAPPDQRRLDAILPHYRSVALHPRIECGVSDMLTPMTVVFFAARHDVAVNTMYAARTEPGNACDVEAGIDRLAELPPDTLGVAYASGVVVAGLWQQRGLHCGQLGALTLCSASGAGLEGLPPASLPGPLPLGVTIAPAQAEPFNAALAASWYRPEPWGVWGAGGDPELRLVLPASPGPLRLTLDLAPPPQTPPVEMRIRAGGRGGTVIATATLSGECKVDLVLPEPASGWAAGGVVTLALDIGHATRISSDPRHFGPGLLSLRLDPVDASGKTAP